MGAAFQQGYSEVLAMESLSHQQLLALTIATLGQLGWELTALYPDGITASINSPETTTFTLAFYQETALVFSHSPHNSEGQPHDTQQNKEHIESFLVAFNNLKQSLSEEEKERLSETLHQRHTIQESSVPLPDTSGMNSEDSGSMLSLFIPSGSYFFTPILIILNLSIFLIMVISGMNVFTPDTETLVQWGANFRPQTLEGEWWRLLSCCFLHIGLIHLVMNMYALMYIGSMLEPLVGRVRFITMYLLAGICASLCSLWWHDDAVVSAGASGAIFGLYGVFLALLSTKLIEKSVRQSLLGSVLTFVAFNLFYGMKGGVDNAAHIGGLVSGFVIAFILYPGLRNRQSSSTLYATVGSLAVGVVILCYAVIPTLRNDIAIYIKKMEEFSKVEKAALEVYALPEAVPQTKLLAEIKDKGIANWRQGLSLLSDISRLKLREEIQKRNSLLKDYCNLRIKVYEYMYKETAEETGIYADSIAFYNQQIAELMEKVKKADKEDK